MSKLFWPVVAMLVTTGCNRTENEPGPGGVTVSEAKALDAAADMLESRGSAAPEAVEPAGTEETPEQ